MANARKAAVSCLLAIDKNGCYSNIAVDNAIKEFDLKGADAALFSALVYGVLDRKLTLDYFISNFSSKPLNKLSSYVLEVLRISVLQLKYMDKIPPFAAINEAVLLIKKSKERYAAGFVNAVLRSVQREEVELPKPVDAKSISITCSCNIETVKKLIKVYGAEKTYLMLKAKDSPLPIYIRVNTVKCTADELLSSFEANGITAQRVENMPNTLAVRGAIEHTDAFQMGWFHVQDLSCQLACEALMADRGMSVLDVCSAPGGKSFTVAQTMQNCGKIVSRDIHQHRVALIEKGARRLGFNCISASVGDATQFDADLGQFDRVLCDVPCSGVGVIHRKPDIRYKNAEEFNGLDELQYKILNTSAAYVKPGGIILYSTCTVFSDENIDVFNRFLKENDSFEALPFEDGDYSKTILPDGISDGFFFARARRKED